MALSKQEKEAIEAEVVELVRDYKDGVQDSFDRINKKYGIPIHEIRTYWIKMEKRYLG